MKDNFSPVIASLLLAATASMAAPDPAPAPASRLVGAWSNVTISKGDDPHASGIEIEIWEENGKHQGFISEYVGPVSDPPVGKLDAIQLDRSSGSIAFTAKLSVGVSPAAGGNAWVPTHNLYEFKGTLSARAITGVLRRKSLQDDGTGLAYDESLTLSAKSRQPAESFEQWSKRWDDAIKARGPKW